MGHDQFDSFVRYLAQRCEAPAGPQGGAGSVSARRNLESPLTPGKSSDSVCVVMRSCSDEPWGFVVLRSTSFAEDTEWGHF
jgi:hypothetical protein